MGSLLCDGLIQKKAMREEVGYSDAHQGRTEKLKRGGDKSEGGRILRKINCFCEILNKMITWNTLVPVSKQSHDRIENQGMPEQQPKQ